jgi:hypothetical protein
MASMSSRANLTGALAGFLHACWGVAFVLATSLGVVAAWRAAGPGGVLSAFMAGAAVGFAFVTPWISTAPWRNASLLMAGPGLGVVSVVILGLAHVIGVASIAVLAALVASAPGARATAAALLANSRRPLAASMVEPPGDHVDLAPVGAVKLDEAFVAPDVMTDEDLGQAWRSSCVALSRATTVSSLLRVVEMRAVYLDELERRAGPEALQAWFRTGACAVGDPPRSLNGRDPGRSKDIGPT